eukprot:TRINITY_DN1869_c1_g1_i1.p1 TRINITY_DN1869_c1_g1~~TRINITY_DN1869_c1_g1_i1.p1  ORF type:complete len:241 (+),score=44.10 TRINITY_DN1869_c1_g1_i1:55-777(+)
MCFEESIRDSCRPSVMGSLQNVEKVEGNRRRKKIVPLLNDVKIALESFTFGEPSTPRSQLRMDNAPCLGTRPHHLRAAGDVPKLLNLRCPIHPELQGVYSLCADNFNGFPMWQSGPARLFSSKQGMWSVVNTPEGPESDLGWITTINTHCGRMPHTISSWQAFNGVWVPLHAPPLTAAFEASEIPKKMQIKESIPSSSATGSADEGSMGPSSQVSGSDPSIVARHLRVGAVRSKSTPLVQ